MTLSCHNSMQRAFKKMFCVLLVLSEAKGKACCRVRKRKVSSDKYEALEILRAQDRLMLPMALG